MPEINMLRLTSALTIFLVLAACGSDSPGTAGSSEPGQPQATTPQPGAGAIAFRGAAIWDGTGSAIKYNYTLLVRDGRIEDIVEEIPAGAEIVDLGGRWVIPGLINAHGHVSGMWADDSITDPGDRVRGDLSLYARYGITSVLSLGGAPAEAFAVRDTQNNKSLSHARLHVAGDVVAGNTVDEASAIARQNIDRGVDWMKLRVD